MSDEVEERIEAIAQEAEDARHFAQTAIRQRKALEDRVDELEAELDAYAEERERLIFRVGKLEAILPTDEDPYEDLSRAERVMKVQNYIMERAYASDGKFAIDYDDVMWSVFDGQPSAGYCYNLMKLAAEEDGFRYATADTKQLRVNLDAVNGDGVLSRVKKDESGVTR